MLSQGYNIREKASLATADFNNYDLNSELTFISWNIANNLGNALSSLQDLVGRITRENLEESVLKIFQIQLFT